MDDGVDVSLGSEEMDVFVNLWEDSDVCGTQQTETTRIGGRVAQLWLQTKCTYSAPWKGVRETDQKPT